MSSITYIEDGGIDDFGIVGERINAVARSNLLVAGRELARILCQLLRV